MGRNISNTSAWAHRQWGNAQLKDKRRTQRAVQLGTMIAQDTAASLPKQTHDWSTLKAAYRLINQADVTHEALSQPHWEATRLEAQTKDVAYILFIQDTTTLNFSSQPSISGLGYTGDACGHGCEIQSCLVVVPNEHNPEIIGLAQQTIWTRPTVLKPKKTQLQRQQHRTEADIWAETLEAIGSVPTGCHWVSVGDRGSDIFSYIRRAKALSWECVLRVTQDRRIETNHAGQQHLKQWIRTRSAKIHKDIILRGRDGRPKRTVSLHITWEAVMIQPPKRLSEKRSTPIAGWAMRCWNDDVALEWILFSTVPIVNENDALTQVQWYEHRWLIEEYHKCFKTGCAVEHRQLTTAHGLFALCGFLSITAVRLLQLRYMARATPQILAQEMMDPLLLAIIAHAIKKSPNKLTVYQFWRGVAKLGGFIGRKSDGEPGWQTIWKGWQQLSLISWGAEWMQQRYEKCG